MHLWLEHVEDVRTERLRRIHDVRPGRILLPAQGECARRTLDRDASLTKRIDELRRGREVRLIARNDVATRIAQRRSLHRRPLHGVVRRGDRIRHRCIAPRIRRPRIAAPTRDRALAHSIDVEQQVLPHPGRIVEHRTIERNRVVDRLPEVPLLRRDRHREVTRGDLPGQHKRNSHRRWAADDLGQHRNGVVERRRVADAAVPPAVVRPARPHCRATLSFDRQSRVHRGAE